MGAAQAFFLVGPTAVGKTAVAHQLALARDLVILSADSMLVYRGLDVGTAKPTARDRRDVTYLGLDLADPWETFSASQWLTAVRPQVREALAQGRTVVVVGGTGLYVRCLLEGLEGGAAPDPALRARLAALHAERGVEGLQAALRRLAPDGMEELADPRNPRRLIRALERAHAGVPAATRWQPRGSPHRITGLRRTAEDLRCRIAQRVTEMWEAGLLEEVRGLRAAGRPWSVTAEHAIGYAEALAVLDRRLTQAEASEQIARRTRQLAKRQMTWFRHQATMAWMDATPAMTTAELARAVSAQWESDGPAPLVI